MLRSVLLLVITPFLLWSTVEGQQLSLPGFEVNRVVLSVIRTMPIGGGYSASAAACRDLQQAVLVHDGRLSVNPFATRSTFCSGATYLVFVRVLQSMLPDSNIDGWLADSLAIRGQADGVGIWGRWNANGPGTACLFHDLGIGQNFCSFEAAQPGDFMKIFWTNSVGQHEHGHSVIYLGRDFSHGIEMVRFWSSNKPAGFGTKTVPRSKIAFAIFSRLQTPERIFRAPSLALRDAYLASLVSSDSSLTEAALRAFAQN